MEPRITANIYTEEIGEHYFDDNPPRGYVRGGEPWVVVHVGGLTLTAVGEDGLAGMRRLVDALESAMAQARVAQQDTEPVSA